MSSGITIEKPAILATGATGKWFAKHHMTGIYELFRMDGLLSDPSIVGIARRGPSDTNRPMSTELLRNHLEEAVRQENESLGRTTETTSLCALLDKTIYCWGDTELQESYTQRIKNEAINHFAGCKSLIVILCGKPSSIRPTVNRLLGNGLLNYNDKYIIVEKPPGTNRTDLESTLKLLKHCFPESAIALYDHYLPKYSVINARQMIRTNPLFLGSAMAGCLRQINVIAHEEEVVDQGRVESYEDIGGAEKDMIQTHLMQVALGIAADIVTVGNGQLFTKDNHLVATNAILNGLQIMYDKCARGQYLGYNKLDGAKNTTDTFSKVVFKVNVEPLIGTEINLVSGKAMNEKSTQIELVFETIPGCTQTVRFVLFEMHGTMGFGQMSTSTGTSLPLA